MNYDFIVVGLGNPGPDYVKTRHNAGYELIYRLIDSLKENGQVSQINGSKFFCELFKATNTYLGNLLIVLPLTFMNDSGKCVQALLHWHKISPDKLLIVHDEMDLKAGEIRFKFGGGNAGHRGLNSITQMLNTPNFYRLRIGIGRPQHKSDVISWVLNKPDQTDKQCILEIFPHALETIKIFADKGGEEASQFAKSIKKIAPTALQ